MKECQQAERISAYHDGELPEASRAALEAHLRVCPVCAAELARLERLSHLIRGMGTQTMRPEALARLHQAVDLQPRLTLMHLAEAFAAVAAAILIASGAWLWTLSTAREASAQIPVWETVAVAPQSAPAAVQEQLTQWIVQDLSRENGND